MGWAHSTSTRKWTNFAYSEEKHSIRFSSISPLMPAFSSLLKTRREWSEEKMNFPPLPRLFHFHFSLCQSEIPSKLLSITINILLSPKKHHRSEWECESKMKNSIVIDFNYIFLFLEYSTSIMSSSRLRLQLSLAETRVSSVRLIAIVLWRP